VSGAGLHVRSAARTVHRAPICAPVPEMHGPHAGARGERATRGPLPRRHSNPCRGALRLAPSMAPLLELRWASSWPAAVDGAWGGRCGR